MLSISDISLAILSGWRRIVAGHSSKRNSSNSRSWSQDCQQGLQSPFLPRHQGFCLQHSTMCPKVSPKAPNSSSPSPMSTGPPAPHPSLDININIQHHAGIFSESTTLLMMITITIAVIIIILILIIMIIRLMVWQWASSSLACSLGSSGLRHRNMLCEFLTFLQITMSRFCWFGTPEIWRKCQNLFQLINDDDQ